MDAARRSDTIEILADGTVIILPPPGLSFDEYMDWLEEKHQERVRNGTVDSQLSDPRRCPVDAPFRLD
jgi:hypothetical protein